MFIADLRRYNPETDRDTHAVNQAGLRLYRLVYYWDGRMDEPAESPRLIVEDMIPGMSKTFTESVPPRNIVVEQEEELRWKAYHKTTDTHICTLLILPVTMGWAADNDWEGKSFSGLTKDGKIDTATEKVKTFLSKTPRA